MKALPAIILVIGLVAAASIAAAAQIQNPVEGYSERTVGPSQPSSLWMGTRPFVGSFTFRSLPAPLEPVTVDFTLTVVHANRVPEGPWELFVWYEPRALRVHSDTTFAWQEPHVPGDEFHGSITFTPLMSGKQGFYIAMRSQEEGLLGVNWYLDPGGQLLFLGKPNDDVSLNLPQYESPFFISDSIFLRSSSTEPAELFDWSVSINPAFRVGDTSEVVFRLTSVKTGNEVNAMQFDGALFHIVPVAAELPGSMMTGDRAEIHVLAIPLAGNAQANLGLVLGKGLQVIRLHCVFDEIGRLVELNDIGGPPYSRLEQEGRRLPDDQEHFLFRPDSNGILQPIYECVPLTNESR